MEVVFSLKSETPQMAIITSSDIVLGMLLNVIKLRKRNKQHK